MGFLPDSNPHKLMINYSMIKLSPHPLNISILLLPVYEDVNVEEMWNRWTDRWTNPNYGMIRAGIEKLFM